MAKITIEGYQCERCDHTWVPRPTTEGEPTICPDCKSPYWNKPRLSETKKKAIKRFFQKEKSK